MQFNLLIHSMAEFASITLKILEAVNAKRIIEIGTEHGGNTKILYDWVKNKNGDLVCIDPCTSNEFDKWYNTISDTVKHVKKPSHDAIHEVGAGSAWFIDGDHNWYTVFNELKLIHEVHEKSGEPLLIFMHDVSWPWARRDLYYNPDMIPEEFRHDFSYKAGVTLGNPNLIEGGFRGEGQFGAAKHEGGQRNGVLTAVEDFLKEHATDYDYIHVPAVFGLGILFSSNHPQAEQIKQIAGRFHQNELLATLEVNRLVNYLKVIEWQDNAAKQERSNSGQGACEDISATALACINLVNDNRNDDLVWFKALSAMPHTDPDLTTLYDYFELLSNVPQEDAVLEIIMSLQAISATLAGNKEVASEIMSDCAQKLETGNLYARAKKLINAMAD